MTAVLTTEDFDFELPEALIADRPAEPRESARLLEVGAAPADELVDRRVADLPDLLRPGDALVVNDTRVIRARLAGRRGAARVEATLLEPAGEGCATAWTALARPARRLRPGDRINFAPGFAAEVAARGEGGEVTLRFPAGTDVLAMLARHGEVPLPPYIKRPAGADARDAADYQTVYARVDGAVAAPTAGLHLTHALLERIRARGVAVVPVTLHVGAGTFLPVKAARPAEHVMHAEWGEVTAEAAARLEAARAAGGRIVAVGTTSLRLLESAARPDGRIAAFRDRTRLFILPGYRFHAIDVLLTNFHLPRSTLFMLVAAFAGLERMKAAYAHAMASGYRFYSYGDATLLHRAEDGR